MHEITVCQIFSLSIESDCIHFLKMGRDEKRKYLRRFTYPSLMKIILTAITPWAVYQMAVIRWQGNVQNTPTYISGLYGSFQLKLAPSCIVKSNFLILSSRHKQISAFWISSTKYFLPEFKSLWIKGLFLSMGSLVVSQNLG